MVSDITADGDGHLDREGHVQESANMPVDLRPLTPVQLTTYDNLPVKRSARVIGKTIKGDLILECKRQAHTDDRTIVVLSLDGARELLQSLFRTTVG